MAEKCSFEYKQETRVIPSPDEWIRRESTGIIRFRCYSHNEYARGPRDLVWPQVKRHWDTWRSAKT